MVSIAALWMPVVVSAVIVFIMSSIIWMVLPIHKGDYSKMPNEDEFMAEVRSQNLPTGMYVYPFCNHKDMKNPEFVAKSKAGPWGYIIASATPPNMGICLGMWFVNLLLIGTGIAFLTSSVFMRGTDYMKIFTFVGVLAFLAHGGGTLTDSIWKGRPWKAMPSNLFDAVVYALLTAGTFGWLWPKLI